MTVHQINQLKIYSALRSMKQKQNNFQFNLASYDFILIPHRLTFQHQTSGAYYLELEKGCQCIRSIPEFAQFNNNNEYFFRKSHSVSIKAYKQRNMNFCWSLYKVIEEKNQTVDVLKFDLNGHFSNYINELKAMQFQYQRLLQKQAFNQPILDNWKSIKSQMRANKVKEVIKNNLGTIIFEFIIEIRSNFDNLTELELQKKKVLKKGSVETDENTSSRNSLRDKNKVNITEQKKLPKTKDSLESNQPSSLSSISVENEGNPQELLKQKIITTYGSTQQQGILCFPVDKLPPINNWAALSDIIQSSNEESSPNKGDKSDRKPSQLSLVQDESNQNFKKTKTFHFGHKQNDQLQFRRNNSMESIKNGSKIDDDQGEGIQEVVEQEQAKCNVDEFTNSSTIIKIHQIKAEPQITFKYYAIILFIFVVFGCLAALIIPTMQQKIQINNQFLRNNHKIKKSRINFSKLTS